MYKLLLCWRYLRTRYIALASVISVALGVATMIVVNSVMAGFTYEMQNRIHGILSDVVLDAGGLQGFPDPDDCMRRIKEIAGPYIAGMTPTVTVPAMLSFQARGQWITRQITFIGVDENTHAAVSDFSKYLQHPDNKKKVTFDLHEDGYGAGSPDAALRPELSESGWKRRRARAIFEARVEAELANQRAAEAALHPPAPEEPKADDPFSDPFRNRTPEPAYAFDPAKNQHTGVIAGIALLSIRGHDGVDHFLELPGDDVRITFPSSGMPPKAISDTFTITDFYESKMSEYDSNFVFVPIRKLQELRGMIDPQTGIGFATSIQIKLKNEADGDLVRDMLQNKFPDMLYTVSTWRDKQGALLGAVTMETAVLNILLFMIIAVAGFGILAIFFMIVVEKTRDIGILKSLGASSRGILGIFLGYGLSLGSVGAGGGLVLGLLFVKNINQVRDLLERLSGRPVFDPTIYYFYKIPTIVDPFTVGWIVVGALMIAVMASILPAFRAARLHPVEALRV